MKRLNSRKRRFADHRRRGVVSVLAMMFLILFGSLAVAMAIASQGNVRTAATHLHVMRAMGAADTGMRVAQDRIQHAFTRFIVDKGAIDESFGEQIWFGSLAGLGEIDVMSLRTGDVPANISDALKLMHDDDENTVSVGGISQALYGSAPSGISAEYRSDSWLFTPAIGLTAQAEPQTVTSESEATGTGFQITYAPLANGTDVRVIVTGFDFSYRTNGVPISRTIMQDYRMSKRVSQAVLSPSRIMLGKNVSVEGDLGAAFEEIENPNGSPVEVRSDFRGLDATLDQELDWLFENLDQFDVDGDNRLRVTHPTEGDGIAIDTDGDGVPDDSFDDVTNDGYVDEFDLFIARYDANSDGKVALSDALRAGTPYAGMTAEFVSGSGDPIDDDLALMLDSIRPDRNRNGVWGWDDANSNGKWDVGEAFNDVDANNGMFSDQVLGYRDGVVDYKDAYAKVRGSLKFRVGKSAWEDEHGSVIEHVAGPIIPGQDKSATTYDVAEEDLPELTADRFSSSKTALQNAVNGLSFEQQVADHLGIAVGALGTYVEPGTNPNAPQFYRLDPDNNNDGRPDNWSTAYYEKMPFNSPRHADYYYRPVFKNMNFKDVEIPIGLNALFENCTFVGVTWVRTYTSNEHVNWSLYGKMVWDGGVGRPVPAYPRILYTTAANYPDDVLPATALPPNQDFTVPQDPVTQSLDKGDFPKNARPLNYDDLPSPLIIGGLRVTDTKAFSNNLRFHDCLFIGSIISDAAGEYTNIRNKMQFTGATRFVWEHPDPLLRSDPKFVPDAEDMDEIATSSMMLPNYSVDLGAFNSPPEQDIRLRGAVIAGVLDIRGNADIDGALLLTFKPVKGEGPLRDLFGNPAGNPAGFNTTIGYFGPDDGDEESLDPNELTIVNGEKIVGWDLDGDGLPDLAHDQTPTAAQIAAGAVTVPFHGYGKVSIRFDPEMGLPDGIMLPLQMVTMHATYQEGRPK